MTPKEKAEELVEKFRISKAITESYAKQCALIALDEIIASNPIAFDEDDNCIEKNWWKEVKQEIETL
jgi:hypothetical protein